MTSGVPFIVPLDKPRLLRSLRKRLILLLVLAPLYFLVLSALWNPNDLLPPVHLTSILPRFISLCVLYSTVCLLAACAAAVWAIRSTRPALTVTDSGIDFHTFLLSGMVLWHDIERITIFRYGSLRYLGIGLRDPVAWLSRLPPRSSVLWRVLWAPTAFCQSLGLFQDLTLISVPEEQLPSPVDEVAKRLNEHR